MCVHFEYRPNTEAKEARKMEMNQQNVSLNIGLCAA